MFLTGEATYTKSRFESGNLEVLDDLQTSVLAAYAILTNFLDAWLLGRLGKLLYLNCFSRTTSCLSPDVSLALKAPLLP
jgi:hypothetical protein